MLSQLLVAHVVGTYFASSIGFVLIALDEFLFCDTLVQEERLACTPPFSGHQVRHCRLTTG